MCDKTTNKFVECSFSKQCWSMKWKTSRQQVSVSDNHQAHRADEAGALLVGEFCSQNFDETFNVCGSNPKPVKLDHYVFDSMSGWNQ